MIDFPMVFVIFLALGHVLGPTLPRRPTTAQNRSKRDPRRPQNGSKTAPGRPKTAQESPRCPKIVPRWLQDASTLPQDGPKTPQVGPREAQRGPRTTQDGPRRGQKVPTIPPPTSDPVSGTIWGRFWTDFGPVSGTIWGDVRPIPSFFRSTQHGPRTPPVAPKMVLLTTLH